MLYKRKRTGEMLFLKNGATMFDRFKDRKQKSGNSIGDIGGKGPGVFKELMN